MGSAREAARRGKGEDAGRPAGRAYAATIVGRWATSRENAAHALQTNGRCNAVAEGVRGEDEDDKRTSEESEWTTTRDETATTTTST